MTATKKNEINFAEGKMFEKIIKFVIPLMFSGILQNLFNMADTVVVGRFAGDTPLAAVGATSALTNLILNLFIGLSMGATITISRHYGSKSQKRMSDASHTAIAISLISGVFLAIVGVFVSKPLLTLMGTPDEVLPLSALYMKVYFSGMPVIMLYNFASGIMRSYGDTKKPLLYLSVAGVINIVLNLIFVIVFHLDVLGVSLATVISQIFSAFLTLKALTKVDNGCKIDLKKIKIHKNELAMIAKTGIPNGVQGCLFSVSNVLIQSSINSFGKITMAGINAASSIESIFYVSMNSFGNTCVTACAQNMGACKPSRAKKSFFICSLCAVAVWVVLAFITFTFPNELLGIFTKSREVIEVGKIKLFIMLGTYFLIGLMEVSTGALRGIGHSFSAMIIAIFGVCVFRLFWIFTVFKSIHTINCLLVSYPVSWGLTAGINTLIFFIAINKMNKKRKNTI